MLHDILKATARVRWNEGVDEFAPERISQAGEGGNRRAPVRLSGLQPGDRGLADPKAVSHFTLAHVERFSDRLRPASVWSTEPHGTIRVLDLAIQFPASSLGT